MSDNEKIAGITGFIAGAIAMGFLLFTLLAISQNAMSAELGAYVGGQTVVGDADAVQVGLTIEWEYVEVDLSHGIKRVGWHVNSEPSWKQNEWQSGSEFSVRVYPLGEGAVRPIVTWSHLSDITRGEPFNDKEEPSSDFVGAGLTVEWKRVEFDVAYGWQLRECRFTKMSDCPDANVNENILLRIRGYFWK